VSQISIKNHKSEIRNAELRRLEIVQYDPVHVMKIKLDFGAADQQRHSERKTEHAPMARTHIIRIGTTALRRALW